MQLKRLVTSTALAVLLLWAGSPAVLAEGGTHTVKPGETLAGIAAQHGTTARALTTANNLGNPDLLRVGQRLSVPGATAPKVTSKPDPAPAFVARVATYTVRSGQTLSQIAALFGVTTVGLAELNGIKNADLVGSGQELIIPGGTNDAGTAQAAGTRFVASISQQRCWLYKDNQLIGNWRCSTGRKESPTVPGSYKVQSKMNPAYASTWDFWMPYWMGLYYSGNIENGIHGLPYNPETGRRTWEGLVGTPITYGCIMLDNENAKILYGISYIGMPVIVLP